MGEDSSTGSNGGGSRRSKKKGGGGGRKPQQQPKPKFTGVCDDLKGHVFDVDSYSPSDNFKKTMEELMREVRYRHSWKGSGN